MEAGQRTASCLCFPRINYSCFIYYDRGWINSDVLTHISVQSLDVLHHLVSFHDVKCSAA